MSKEWSKTFISPNVHKATMPSGQELTFYPVSIKVASELRSMIGPIAHAATILFSNKDAATVVREEKEGKSTSTFIPPTVEHLEAESTRRADAVERALETLMDPKNLAVVGKIIMDSLRDEFPRGDKNNPSPDAFIGEVDSETLTCLIIAVAKANKGVFGPLTQSLGGVLQAAEGALKAKVAASMPEKATEAAGS